MPNITSPASLEYLAGTLRTRRVVPARLRYASGNVMNERSTAAAGALAVPNLDRLTFADRLQGEDEMTFMRRAAIWQTTMGAIEEAFSAINARVDELAAILARLSAAEMLASVANDNAVAAQQVATTVQEAARDTFAQIDPTYADGFDSRMPI